MRWACSEHAAANSVFDAKDTEMLLDSRLCENDRARGVQRGEAPLRFLWFPKNGGQGVEEPHSV